MEKSKLRQLDLNINWMKLKVEVSINRHIDRVSELFGNHENTIKWMNGLRSVELISGERGQPGARSRVQMVNGFISLNMTETVHVRDLPTEYSFRYDADSFTSHSRNCFKPVDDSKTIFTMSQTIKFKGALKMTGILAKGTIHSQMLENARSFKKFAEEN